MNHNPSTATLHRSKFESIRESHVETIFIPLSQIPYNPYQVILTTFASITLLHIFSIVVIRILVSSIFRTKNACQQEKSSDDLNSIDTHKSAESLRSKDILLRKEIMSASYQVTNMITNIFLGSYGLIHFISNPFSSSSPVDKNTIINMDISYITAYSSYSIFGMMQIGYILWSLPVGIFMIQESKAMIIHHVATLVISFLSAFARTGFRYYAPFFFGMIELSSVPLAIVNYMKDHYTWTQQYCPVTYLIVRLIFAVSFLWLRVVLWVPQIYHVLRDLAVFGWTCPTMYCALLTPLFWLPILFLTLLQLHWGALILKGLFRIFQTRKEKIL